MARAFTGRRRVGVVTSLLGLHAVMTAVLWVARPFADDTCLTNDCETRKSFVEAFGLLSVLSLAAAVGSLTLLWLVLRRAGRLRVGVAAVFAVFAGLCLLMGFVIPTQE